MTHLYIQHTRKFLVNVKYEARRVIAFIYISHNMHILANKYAVVTINWNNI